MKNWFTKKTFTTEEAFNIRDYTVRVMYPILDEYIEWYCEHGVSLPESYDLDPTGWTEVLRKIQRAFMLASTANEEGSELHTARITANIETVTKLEGEIQTGFCLYGKHLNDLWDKYGVPDDYGYEVTH